MNLALGIFWSVPAILLLLLGIFTAGKENSFLKGIGIVSLLAGGFLFVSSILLLLGWWPVH